MLCPLIFVSKYGKGIRAFLEELLDNAVVDLLLKEPNIIYT